MNIVGKDLFKDLFEFKSLLVFPNWICQVIINPASPVTGLQFVDETHITKIVSYNMYNDSIMLTN